MRVSDVSLLGVALFVIKSNSFKLQTKKILRYFLSQVAYYLQDIKGFDVFLLLLGRGSKIIPIFIYFLIPCKAHS